MKLTFILLTIALLQVSAKGTAQTITFTGKNVPLEQVFTAIKKQTGYVVFFDYNALEGTKPITLTVRNAPLTDVLDQVLREQSLRYSIRKKTIFIIKSPEITVPSNQPTAPPININGRVTDEKGNPLAGANIQVKGTKTGTTTDANGFFKLTGLSNDAVLEISYLGYVKQVMKVMVTSGEGELKVTLKISNTGLDQVQVIGYGTTTKRMSTGSLSSISSAEIEKQPVGNVLNALQGRVSGAFVSQSGGLPGSRVNINIRGIAPIDGLVQSQPLYIVDGIPFMMMTGSPFSDLNERGLFAANRSISPLSMINPNDIERIDILKDADATAIYGARGTNGVVLITTKKGSSGKTKLELNVYQGMGTVPRFLPLMNTQQYLQMRKDAFANDGFTPNAANAPDLLVWDQNAYTDWQEKYIGGTAGITDAQATVSGGDLRTRFLFNAGYHRETTVFPGNFSDYRISGRFNADHNSLNRKFNANISVSYSFGKSNLLQRDLTSIYNLPPNMPLYKADGSLLWNANFTNPEAHQLATYFAKTNNLITSTNFKYTILPGLDIKTSFGFNTIALDQNTQSPAASKNPFTSVLTNSAQFATINQKTYIAEPQITYAKDLLGGKFSALLGSSFQNSLFTSFTLAADNYSTASLLGSPSGAGNYNPPTIGHFQYRYNSIFGRVNYNYDGRYLINAVLRRDGSTRFGPGKRFGNFWSVGGAWIFSSESFAENLPFLSFGKLRASYGKTGSDVMSDYSYLTLFTTQTSYQNVSAVAPNRINNPLLRWQTTYKLEFGMDLGFLKDRLLLTANYYRGRTPDQLGTLKLASQSGFNTYQANFDALIRNTGFELEINSVNVQNNNFKWTSSFNITIPRTIVVEADPLYTFYSNITPGQHQSAARRFLYRGVDAATGRPLYTDIKTNTPTLTPNQLTDLVPVGYSAPSAYGGLNNQITFKNFDLSFFFQFTRQEGAQRPLAAPGVLTSGNQVPYFLDVWRKAGDTGPLPRYSTTSAVYGFFSASEKNWGDASFIRLRNINLSYTLPRQITSRIKMDNVRLYLQAQNVYWWSKLRYSYDPETFTSMPPLRTLTVGINVTL